MIKKIALDPELFCQWEHHRALRHEFAVEKGRLIAAFPKKWKVLVRALSETLEANGKLSSLKAETIRNWLAVSSGGDDPRFIRCGCAYDGAKAWHLNAEDQAQSFDVILSQHAIGAANAILADSELEYQNDSRFKASTQDRVPRNANALIACVWPLVRASSSIRIVEPNFIPNEDRFMKPFECLVDRLVSDGSSIKLVELHVLRSPSFSDTTKRNYKNTIDPILRTGYQVKVFFWADGRERLHDRYLLTDRGGIDLTWGWDEGQPTETTPVKILEEHMWRKEWDRYRIGTADFNIDPLQHVMLIGTTS
ncbi:MAG: hypothetical protein Q8M07_17705 [Prosthecobacter sp.]|nr:hypothetical protein [Prosthecobacter sp.]